MNERITPFFSVIVPVYNNIKDLKKCIFSIITQSCTDFELIIVDDGSTDGSSELCDWFADKDERINVVRRNSNGGVACARNEGLTYAKGKYVYYVDGDDWIAKKLLESARKELDKEYSPDIYSFCYVKVMENGRHVKRCLNIKEGLYDKEKLKREVYPGLICKVEKSIQFGIDSGSLCDKIIRRELLEKHYCRDTSLFCAEDSVCSWECIYYADKIFFSESGMYFYNRMSVTSNTKKYHADLFENNKKVAEYLREYLNAGDDVQIQSQINAFEFRGVVRAIQQEINYYHSICYSAKFLKEKCGEETICSHDGLPLQYWLYIFLINHRCFKMLLMWVVFQYGVSFVSRIVKFFISRHILQSDFF